MDDLTGRVAVVTGGANGIGYAMAEAFAGAGAKLVLADVNGAELDTAVRRLGDAGATVSGVVTDVSDAAQVDALRDAALATHGAVHVVCNNAGVGTGGVSWEVSLEQYRWVLGVDLFGVIHGVHTFAPLLVEQGEGHIVNTSSMAGLLSSAFMAPYNIAKHGVVTLSETLFAELASMAPGVGVSVLCPGWVNTRIYDAPRYGKAGLGTADGDDGAQGVAEVVKGLVADGLDPADVAAQVLDAVLTRRFYVLTHPEWMPLVAERTRRTIDGDDPTVGMLPADA
ncbi:MAG TPA: SDR family NAD(P)-dependent oxidoreductase [Acidimicrobiales bacterium]|nr:SDR family NAD(P)-dependent oxidoreductase [Acidimicrobiales bacterium]